MVVLYNYLCLKGFMRPEPSHIEAVRDASRRLVRELGFMRPTLAGTAFSPSAVHALIEISAHGSLGAGALADHLRLEKSSVSRLVRKLIDAGAVSEKVGEADGRTKLLALTPKGKKQLSGIHEFARAQVAAALERLPQEAYVTVRDGLNLYAEALAGTARVSSVTIAAGYAAGLLARCVGLHADYYSREHGFGRAFEAGVAGGLAAFCARLDHPGNQIWRAETGGRTVGTIAIDGEDLNERRDRDRAHLRWFIVEDGLQGRGVGRDLLAAAMAFCDRQAFSEIHLWTFRGLDAARRLYEAHGFILADEHPGAQWGTEVMEQHFVRVRSQK